jgi:hypothetical protein
MLIKKNTANAVDGFSSPAYRDDDRLPPPLFSRFMLKPRELENVPAVARV